MRAVALSVPSAAARRCSTLYARPVRSPGPEKARVAHSSKSSQSAPRSASLGMSCSPAISPRARATAASAGSEPRAGKSVVFHAPMLRGGEGAADSESSRAMQVVVAVDCQE
jgi:hypothetical protein